MKKSQDSKKKTSKKTSKKLKSATVTKEDVSDVVTLMDSLKINEINDIDVIDTSEYNFTILSRFSPCYPIKTDVLCWWCCHQFDTHPLGIPYKIDKDSDDPSSDVFYLMGCFCSMGCILSYIKSKDYSGKCTKLDLLYMIRKITNNKTITFDYLNSIQPAPNRIILKKFGGNNFHLYSNFSR